MSLFEAQGDTNILLDNYPQSFDFSPNLKKCNNQDKII